MKAYTMLDKFFFLLTLSLMLKIFLTMARFGSVHLPVVTLPGEFHYLSALLF